ncbi:hypothetical protein EXE46_12960 [Halorubrum sp. GN11_10-6_MGM]|uniref:hypothetical protein n=1 Tax=Halorubrum sp. GN11_10-6_MGM TaxID=2518112 RepID=UPI0010F62D7C|nr:hypothetical protein [Halorubrum sp. GN11_10-6_MGM]TKX73700.1 hypothetical protein EXE46_12960 [Halorubrum sp. GN11_10-6_MGM]
MSTPSARVESRRRVDRDALDAVIAGYHRAERAASWGLALLVICAFLGAVAALSLWPGVAVALVLAVALRVPVFRRTGSVRLRTTASPDAVAEEFASVTPPILAFQWGVADGVREPPDATAAYAFSYLLGLRTAAIDLDVDLNRVEGEGTGSAATGDGDDVDRESPVATIEIEGTARGKPWGSYAVAVREAPDGGSVVDVELRPTRRFDLRMLPQGWVADRYYADALAAQGYEVVERSVSLTR